MEINKPIKKLFDISGRNFVISGSAGMLGKEFSTTMCKAGANVILLDINQIIRSLKIKSTSKSCTKKPMTPDQVNPPMLYFNHFRNNP